MISIGLIKASEAILDVDIWRWSISGCDRETLITSELAQPPSAAEEDGGPGGLGHEDEQDDKDTTRHPHYLPHRPVPALSRSGEATKKQDRRRDQPKRP